MTKYLIFKNEPASGKTNVPGSREEMACAIAMVSSEESWHDNSYVAYPADSPKSTFETLKGSANYALVLDDKLAELWNKEFIPLTRLSDAIDEAIGDAYQSIYSCAEDFDSACEESENCKDIGVLDYMGIDRAFDNFEHQCSSAIASKVEEIYQVKTF